MKVLKWMMLCGLCVPVVLSAQTVSGALPPSFSQALASAVPTTALSVLDNQAFIAEDAAEYDLAMQTGETPAYRIARPQDVNLNLNNAGRWETLPNGDRVWRLRLVSPGATDLYLQYNQWRLVKPCELYLYNDDHSQVLGPYTYIDNWDGTNITPIIKGEAVTLEYSVPADIEDIGELSVAKVLHGYRNFLDRNSSQRDPLDAYGQSMPCMINVRCFPAWQDEKLSVAMIIDPMGGACTGNMLNNTLQNGDPLFLTAFHCLNGRQNNWLFYFNYESPNCSPTSDGSYIYVISNASLLASYQWSDFALLRLSRPRPETPFVPRFEGWDRNNIAPESSVGIHHPAADIKKIHSDIDPGTSDFWFPGHPDTHWMTHIDLGMMEPGSSGSPLFDEYSRVVGQLHGGSWDCDAGTINDALYGKLAVSWDGDGTSSGRLRDWLDPNNSGAWYTNPWQPSAPANDSCGPGQNVPLITSVPYSTSGSTQWAANNVTGGCHANSAPDVVYNLQMSCDYVITVSTCGSSFDTQLYVVAGGSCSQYGLVIGCNDDFCETQSQYTFTAQANQLYSIWVDGYASSWGNYAFNVSGYATSGPPNAQCPGTTIGAVPFFEYTATYCGGDNFQPSCQAYDAEDVVYNWVSPYNQPMRAKTCYNGFDTILEVMYLGGCPGTWSAGCNDDACGSDGYGSSVVFDASAGVPYYFHIDGYNGATGITSFQLEAWNDDCATPYVIPSIPFNDFGDTRPARDDFATVIGPDSPDLFFQYTSPICQTVGVSLCGLNGYDTGLEVRTGGPCPGTTLIAFNDDFCGLQSQLTFGAEANRTYYIIVGGYSTSSGPFAIQFYQLPASLPANDVCPGIAIPALPFADYGSTACASNNYFNCVGTYAPEVVYYLNRPQCENVTVTLCGSNYDTGLGVYGGVCPNISPLIVCNDDSYCNGNPTLQSTATFTAQANMNYQILVHGFSNYSGLYALYVSSVPCPVAPQPVTDLVIQPGPGPNDFLLAWTPMPNADQYQIYAATSPDSIFLPANLLTTVAAPPYACSACVNTMGYKHYFGVIGDNIVPLAVSEQGEGGTINKADAMMGSVDPNLETLALRGLTEEPHWNEPEKTATREQR